MRIAGTVLAAVLLALGGCKGPPSVQEAAGKVATFHRQLDAGDYAAIVRTGGPELRADKKELVRLLGMVHDQLGKTRATKQIGWRSEVNTSGSIVEVTMDTRFERGTARETFIFHGSGGEQRLAGYQIDKTETGSE